MVQRRDIDFDFKREEVIEKPYEVIRQENKPCPAVDVNSRLKGEKVDDIAEPDLSAGQDQDDKTPCIYPVPDSYR